ncbi:centromere protein S isoform X1 [Ovis aries]|uniref:centromere protein S isoform X1 n=1 Tax=Ovis aries TaxID=9940 RepID=UPI0029526C42|nr:centromere protein S isoform X1 [Ovis aries]
MTEEEEWSEEQQSFSYRQRLKAAVHYTVGCLCEEVSSDKDMQFSKQTIAAISEVTFGQCENFAKDLEMFARHAKRSTVNTEDVKLLARRSHSLVRDGFLSSLPFPIRIHYSQLITGIHEVIPPGHLALKMRHASTTQTCL